MKKLNAFIALVALSFVAGAQARVSLLEEFTGENCIPCAHSNPALDLFLEKPATAGKIIALKWQVPIPSTPTNPQSLYQQNKPEIDWRYKGVAFGAYGYPAQYDPSAPINDGILNAPTCFIDGKNQWAFGATTDHPYYLTNSVVNSASSVSTPFSINMSTSWNSTFNNCVVSVTVTSSSAFNSLGSLMFRLCLVERYIKLQAPTGTNGEKVFHDVVRQSYPTTGSAPMIAGMGTLLPSVWTPAQTQVFTVNCAIPSYIHDKSQMAFVGFVQDDGDRQVYQTARTSEPSIPNDAKAESVNIPHVICSAAFVPSVTIKNNGPTAITAFNVTPVLDMVSGAIVSWNGNLPAFTSTTIPLNNINMTPGTHTFGFNISGVSGGDIVMVNNQTELVFLNASSYFPAPLSEGFESPPFPATNWLLPEPGGLNMFKIDNYGGYNASGRSLSIPLLVAPPGRTEELYLPPTDLMGTLNSELSFDLAYQQRTSNMDSLTVLLSSDCGNSWVKIYNNGGSSMATAGPNTFSGFFPSSGQWTTAVIPLSGYATSPQVLVKFQLKTDAGNGFFLDNINLKPGLPTHAQTTQPHELHFSLFPNPANSLATIMVNSVTNQQMRVEIVNSIGQLIHEKTYAARTGLNSLTIDCSELLSGVYFVNLKSEGSRLIKKLIISK